MVDYSKWKNIEISDDEDDTHPNIDTPSLFRWRHEARVERMDELKREKDMFENKKQQNKVKLEETKKTLSEKEALGIDVSDLKASLEALLKEEAEIKKKEEDLKAKDRVMPWNVDTISNPGFTKTVINSKAPRKQEELSDEEREKRMQVFIKENEKLLKEYGMLRKYDDSKRYLLEHPQLVCEDTANYLVIWCIRLEMEDKSMLAQHVAHQCICMQYILELSKQLDVDPRSCVGSFFSKIQIAEPEYKASFDDELRAFKERISRRAKEKLEAALREQEEEERKARLGPGGLDPVEVFESLPKALQDCFEKQDIPMLQEVIANMPQDEAAFHMKRCVDSGLWLPDGGKKDSAEGGDPGEEPTETDDKSDKPTTEQEGIYQIIHQVD
uniref:Hsp90 co-chaperone Cdc37 n=1 Tax=Lygus hesperus TaxID=30085 RepID=A0A0A9YDS2_LYGHE